MRTLVVAGVCSALAVLGGLLSSSSPSIAQESQLASPPPSDDADPVEEARDELAKRLFERAQRERAREGRPASGSALESSPPAPRASSVWDPAWSPLDPRPLGRPPVLRAPAPTREASLPEPQIQLPPPVPVPIIPPAPERVAESPRQPSLPAVMDERFQTGAAGGEQTRARRAPMPSRTHASPRKRAHVVSARNAPRARTFGDVFRIVGRGMGNGMSCVARGNCKSARHVVEGAMGAVSVGIVGAGVGGGPGLVTGSIVGAAAAANFRKPGNGSHARWR